MLESDWLFKPARDQCIHLKCKFSHFQKFWSVIKGMQQPWFESRCVQCFRLFYWFQLQNSLRGMTTKLWKYDWTKVEHSPQQLEYCSIIQPKDFMRLLHLSLTHTWCISALKPPHTQMYIETQSNVAISALLYVCMRVCVCACMCVCVLNAMRCFPPSVSRR